MLVFVYTLLFTSLSKGYSQRGSLHPSLNLDCLLLTSDIYLLNISIIKHEYDHFPIINSFVIIYRFVATKNLLVNPHFFQWYQNHCVYILTRLAKKVCEYSVLRDRLINLFPYLQQVSQKPVDKIIIQVFSLCGRESNIYLTINGWLY